MTHFAILCPPYAGHLDPMLALARGLGTRGHRATLLGIADVEPRADGVGFAAFGPSAFPSGSLAGLTARLGRTTGLLGLGAVVRATARMTDVLCEEAPALLGRIGAEAVLADQTEAAGGLVARHLGLPFVSVANALLIDREPAVPPPFVGWAYDASPNGVRRNLGAYRIADWIMRPVTEVVSRNARAFGLGGIETVEDCLSRRLELSQTVEALDFPRRAAPSGLRYVGPLRGPDAGAWTSADPRPLVFSSLGTLQGGRLPVFRAIAEACRARDLALLVAHGGRLDAGAAASLPGHPRVEAFVPQRAVLRQAVAAVTHGGLNTVLDALAAGVPLVVVPLAFEQGAIAARVARSGAGLVIPLRRLTPARLAEALERLRVEPRFKARAAEIAAGIAAAGGVSRAVGLIEDALHAGL